MLASDVRIVTDGGGKVRSAVNVIECADRAAQFLIDVTRKRADAWWREDFRPQLGIISTVCYELSWMRERGRCKRRRSRLTATSSGYYTWCAIRRSNAT